jgi:hypothetical protein
MVADELRRQADNFIELEDLRSQIGRDPPARVVAQSRQVETARTDDTDNEDDDRAPAKASA